jgi:hypothetical protein
LHFFLPLSGFKSLCKMATDAWLSSRPLWPWWHSLSAINICVNSTHTTSSCKYFLYQRRQGLSNC